MVLFINTIWFVEALIRTRSSLPCIEFFNASIIEFFNASINVNSFFVADALLEEEEVEDVEDVEDVEEEEEEEDVEELTPTVFNASNATPTCES